MKKLLFFILASLIFFDGCSHDPLGLNKSEEQVVKETVVSVRVDDFDFSSKQETVLRTIVWLARKYGVVVDLGIIARRFEDNWRFDSDNIQKCFAVYKENLDILELAAHGLTHTNPIFPKSVGEFYDTTRGEPVPEGIQESHIQEMKEIFKSHDLQKAQEIFFVPWNAGDENTIRVAERYGYRFISQDSLPNGAREMKSGNIFASNVFLNVNYWERSFTKEDIQNYCRQFSQLLAGDWKLIEIVMHPVNFTTPESIDELIGELIKTANSTNGKKIKFDFVSGSF